MEREEIENQRRERLEQLKEFNQEKAERNALLLERKREDTREAVRKRVEKHRAKKNQMKVDKVRLTYLRLCIYSNTYE